MKLGADSFFNNTKFKCSSGGSTERDDMTSSLSYLDCVLP